MGRVPGEDAALELDPAVGDHERPATVEDTADHRPVVRPRRPRPVVHGIPDVGGGVGALGVPVEQLLHRLHHSQAELVTSVLARVAHVDVGGVRKQGRLPDPAPALVSIGREQCGGAADGNEPLGPSLEHVRDDPQAAVLRDDEIERLVADALEQGLLEMRVDVDVPDAGHGELDLVLPAVQDRDLEAAVVEALDDERPGRTGASDDEGARAGHRRSTSDPGRRPPVARGAGRPSGGRRGWSSARARSRGTGSTPPSRT